MMGFFKIFQKIAYKNIILDNSDKVRDNETS